MKKILLAAFTLSGIISANAQSWVADSIIAGNAYKNRVFYSLESGQVGTFEFNNRDFLVDVNSFSASIRINGGFNAALYRYTAGDTSAWASLDTAGLAAGTNFTRCYDDAFEYFPSAFESTTNGGASYGWGEYSGPPLHIVVGTKLFVYKTVGTGTAPSQVWKKVWIVKKDAGKFTVRTADLNGANDHTFEIDATQGAGSNFVYYSFDTDKTYTDEPNADTYDIIFTKYEGYINNNPVPPSRYALSGVNNNLGVYASRAFNIPEDDAAFANFPITDSSYATIGDSWKGLYGMAYATHDSTSYFIADRNNNLWQLAFTKFYTGSGANIAKYVFKKRKLATASIEENVNTGAWTVFPNPAAEQVSVVFTANVADNAQFSLIDLNGRTVLAENFASNKGVNQYSVDLGSKNLPAGVYVATLRAGNVLKTTKLIIR